jgi:hypothetical protein
MTDDRTASDQGTTGEVVEAYEAPRLTDEGSIAELTGGASCFPSLTGGWNPMVPSAE